MKTVVVEEAILAFRRGIDDLISSKKWKISLISYNILMKPNGNVSDTKKELLTGQFLPGNFELFEGFFCNFRIREIERPDLCGDDIRDKATGYPLVICRYDIPWRCIGARLGEHHLIGGLVIVPELALCQIGQGKLPVFLFVLETVQEPLLLFLP